MGTAFVYLWQNHSSRKRTMPQEMWVLCVQVWAEFSADLASAMKTPSLDMNLKRQKDVHIHRKILVCTLLGSGLSNECLSPF